MQIDLVDIVRIYEKKYGVTLAEDISGDTSGDYEDILLKIIKIPDFVLIEEAQELARQEAEKAAAENPENAEGCEEEEGNQDGAGTEDS